MTVADGPLGWTSALAREAGLEPGSPSLGGFSVRAVGLGWATVETERVTGDLAGRIPALAFGPAPPDELLGATARVGRTEAGAPDLVVLEPSTEGRLAATLARRGEGPTALYLRPSDGLPLADVAGRLRRAGIPTRAGDGPLGPELLVTDRPAGSPQLLLVGVPSET